MFNEYLYEIIAVILLLLVLAIKAIVKSDTAQEEEISFTTTEPLTEEKNQEKHEHKETQELIEDEYENQYENDLDGTQEGDFGETKENNSTQDTQKHKTIHKRAVPSHEKITKHNFSEFSGERILVAEDNLINQKVMTGLLAGSGIEVVLADDGQIVLDILEEDDDFLLILMDAHMPRVDGFEATRSIRANSKYDHILVVALSGDTAADDIAKMRDAGMAEQLEKPLRMNDLYDIFYAYTGNEKVKDDEDFIEVVMTKELNGNKGLEVCGGDDNFYHEILNEFMQTYASSAEKLEELLKNEKIREADKLLLDVIGITANIGADPLHKIAQEIKNTLTDTDKKSYLTLADEYKKHLTNLIQDIKNYK